VAGVTGPKPGGSYDPDLYDIVTPAALGGDADWYRRQARESGGPVLELGAGTGRITLAIAKDGVSIHALDADQGMVATLRRKVAELPRDVQSRLVVVEGDMRAFQLKERFALIIAPFRAFLHNLTEDDQLACLRRVHEHLRPGGRFAFNVFHPSLEYMVRNSGALAGVWRWTGTFPAPDGGHVVRTEATRYDTLRRRVHSHHRYEDYGPDGALRRTFLHRLELAYLYPEDIRHRLEQGGFRSVRVAGGFDGRPVETDADELVIEAVRD
jgi:SAM-dependent methyltransferase